jgi:nicotinate dehydrogenase subunit B
MKTLFPTPTPNSRRRFLKQLGNGVVVVFYLGELSFSSLFAQELLSPEDLDFNAYLRVKEDGRVDCFTGKIEMGQGIITSLAQVVAEELEVSIYDIDMIMGDTELCPYDRGTWGSLTTRFTDPVLRAAAAEAREVLLALASEQLGVPRTDLTVKDGVVSDTSDASKTLTYAQLTKGQKIVKALTKKPDLKTAKDFKLIGKPIRSLDAEAKVTGKAKYSGDILLPGMVHATVVRPEVFGSKKVRVNASQLADFPGAELVEQGDLVAVVHNDPEVSNRAAKRVTVTWEAPKLEVNQETIFQYLEDTIINNDVFQNEGNLEIGKAEARTYKEARYFDGYKAHASMETHVATCRFDGDKLTLWASTQSPFGTRDAVAKALNMPLEKVHVKQIFLGGGFGGKSNAQQSVEAATIAKLCGKPVQLVWSRPEEFMYDNFRPAAVIKVAGGCDSAGKLNLWDFDIYCSGTRGTELFYDIPHYRIRNFNQGKVHPFGTGAWRAPGNNTTTFARESHIDVMAHAVGMDPLAFRLQNLGNPDMVDTLQLAAQTFGYDTPKSPGHGYGIALGHDAGTLVAMIAEVSVDKDTGKVTPIRIVCAQDMGQVVNPHGATIQTEGGITMGIGYALFEEIEFEGGIMKTTNFNRYEITRFSTTPKIECVFIDKMDAKPQGGGEPAIITVGAAIANAVFDACGARVNRMPITPERVLAGIS